VPKLPDGTEEGDTSMMLRNALKYGLLSWALIGSLIYGCATLGPALQTGMTALQIVDSFYDFVVAQQKIPGTLQAATIILQQADAVAAMAKEVNTPELIAQAKMLNSQANKL
jgi:hypothetical protein